MSKIPRLETPLIPIVAWDEEKLKCPECTIVRRMIINETKDRHICTICWTVLE